MTCPHLPVDIWVDIARQFIVLNGVREWVKTCGSVCQAFNRVQPLQLSTFTWQDGAYIYLPIDIKILAHASGGFLFVDVVFTEVRRRVTQAESTNICRGLTTDKTSILSPGT